MLDSLRNAARSLVAKILFGLLVVSFAIWGIGDIFRGGGFAKVVAEVGDQRITAQEFTREYRRYIEQLRPVFGGNLDTEKAKQLGFPNQVLQRMIGQAVFDQGVQDLDVTISDKVVRAQIMADPRLQEAGGKFNTIAFRELLMKAGYSEEGFVKAMRDDIARSILIRSVNSAGFAPTAMVDAFYRLQEETRIADYVEIDAGTFDDVGEPDDAAVEAYYKKHAEAFTAPEYRKVTYVALTSKSLAKGIEVSEDELKQAYEERKARFSTPERRTLEQMVLKDEDTAKRAEKMLADGADFAQVAKDLANQDKDAIELGTVRPDQIPGDLRQAAFGVAEGAVSQPVKTAFGWHIIKAVKVIPGTSKSFDEVKDELHEELAEEKARDEIDGLSNKLEDALAGGATIEEAANKLGLNAKTIEAIDSRGLDASGNPIADLPSKNFVSTGFETEEGQTSVLTEIPNDGYFVLRVDKVTPSAQRPLAEVRDVVVSGWKGEQRQDRAKAEAEEIAGKIKGGKSIQDEAAEYKLTVQSSEPFKRGQPGSLPEALVKELFKDGTGTVGTSESPAGYMVAVVTKVTPADPAANKDAVAKMQQQLNKTFGTDYLVEYGAALERRYKVKVNEEQLNSLF